jgi:hypothetical protein
VVKSQFEGFSSFYFVHFSSSELCSHWLTKNKRCLWLVQKHLSVNYCNFLTSIDAVTENPHINIFPLRNITNPTGWDSVKMSKDYENVFALLVMVSIGALPWKGHLPARQFIKMDRLIPVSTHLSFH